MERAVVIATSPTAELDRLGDEIAELSAHLDAATARLLALIREFDARGGWNQGFRSCAEWLSWRVGLDLGAAREKVRVARALGELPLLAEALARGEISYSKVRAITRIATPETEARLLKVARAGSAAHVERLVWGWRRVDRLAEARECRRRHASRSLQVCEDEDGMVVIRGRLEPEVGALLQRALEAGSEALYQKTRNAEAAGEDPPTPAQRRADALALVAETALQQGLDSEAVGERATRWSCTSTPRCWRTLGCQASQSWRAGRAFPRKRRAASPATPTWWRPGRSWTWGGGRGPSRQHSGWPSATATGAAASRAAASASARAITSSTGPTAAPRAWTTSRSSAGSTTARSTRRATGSSASRVETSASGGRTAG
jgi:hypothetical protein